METNFLLLIIAALVGLMFQAVWGVNPIKLACASSVDTPAPLGNRTKSIASWGLGNPEICQSG